MCRQHQEDDDDGKAERRHKAARFLLELARFAAVVDGVPLRQSFRGNLGERSQRFTLGAPVHSLDGGRVQPLEVTDRLRHRAGA